MIMLRWNGDDFDDDFDDDYGDDLDDSYMTIPEGDDKYGYYFDD